MPDPEYRFVNYESHDDGTIVRIMLNRPETRNAQHRSMLVELNEAFLRAEADDTVRPYADHLMEIPAVSMLFQPLLSTIPLQVFAASLARAQGYDIDKPRNLAKSVTVE